MLLTYRNCSSEQQLHHLPLPRDSDAQSASWAPSRSNGYFADVPYISPLEAKVFFDELRRCRTHRLSESEMYDSATNAFFDVCGVPEWRLSDSVAVEALCTRPTSTAFPPLTIDDSAAPSWLHSWLSIAAVNQRNPQKLGDMVSSCIPEGVRRRWAVRVLSLRKLSEFVEAYDTVLQALLSRPCHDARGHAGSADGLGTVVVLANADEAVSSPGGNAHMRVLLHALCSLFRSPRAASGSCRVVFTGRTDVYSRLLLQESIEQYAASQFKIAVGAVPVASLHTQGMQENNRNVTAVMTLGSFAPSGDTTAEVLEAVADAVTEVHNDLCAEMEASETSPIIIVPCHRGSIAAQVESKLRDRYVAEELRIATDVKWLRNVTVPFETSPVVLLCDGRRSLLQCLDVIQERGMKVSHVVCPGVVHLGKQHAPNDAAVLQSGDAIQSIVEWIASASDGESFTVLVPEGLQVLEKSADPTHQLLIHSETDGWVDGLEDISAPAGSSHSRTDWDAAVEGCAVHLLWWIRRVFAPISKRKGRPGTLALHMLLGAAMGEARSPASSSLMTDMHRSLSEIFVAARMHLIATGCCHSRDEPEMNGAISPTPLGRVVSEGLRFHRNDSASVVSGVDTCVMGDARHTTRQWLSALDVIPLSRWLLALATFRTSRNDIVAFVVRVYGGSAEPSVVRGDVASWLESRGVRTCEGASEGDGEDLKRSLQRIAALWAFHPVFAPTLQKVLHESAVVRPSRLELLMCAREARREALASVSSERCTRCRGWYEGCNVAMIDATSSAASGSGGEAAAAGADASSLADHGSTMTEDTVDTYQFPPLDGMCALYVTESASVSGAGDRALIQLPVELSEILIATKIWVSASLENNCILSQGTPAPKTVVERSYRTSFSDPTLIHNVTLRSILGQVDHLAATGGETASGIWVDGELAERDAAVPTREDRLQHLTKGLISYLKYCDHKAFIEEQQRKKVRTEAAAAAEAAGFTGKLPPAKERSGIEAFINTCVKRLGREVAEQRFRGKPGYRFINAGDPSYPFYEYHVERLSKAS